MVKQGLLDQIKIGDIVKFWRKPNVFLGMWPQTDKTFVILKIVRQGIIFQFWSTDNISFATFEGDTLYDVEILGRMTKEITKTIDLQCWIK